MAFDQITAAGNATRAFIALGSNLGDRLANLDYARRAIRSLGLDIALASAIFETEPVGLTDQLWFLNQVIAADVPPAWPAADEPADAEPELVTQALALLDRFLDIERRMGRERVLANGPRLIDIDLLLLGSRIISVDKPVSLHVPHPRLHLRRFVLEPLAEIAPDLVHPLLAQTIIQLLTRLHDPSAVRRFSGSSASRR